MATKKTVKGSAAQDAVRSATTVVGRGKTPVALRKTSSTYEPLMVDFFDHLRSGGSAAAFARAHGVTASAMRSYAWAHYRDEYERAQRESADAVAEQAVAVSTSTAQAQEKIETTYSDGSTTVAVKTFDNVQRAKLSSESLWKLAAAKNPAKYGTKQQSQESSGIASEIQAARARLRAKASEQTD